MDKFQNLSRENPFHLNRQEIALIFVTMLWGTTFLTVQYGLNFSGPFFFVGLRFAFAAFAGLIVSFGVLKGMTIKDIVAGTVIGLSIFLGYSLHTIGLLYMPSSKSAFILALYVPCVPVLQWVFLRRRPPLMRWIGILFAFIGLLLLSSPDAGHFTIGKGELITLVGAVVIAAEIILISFYAGKVDIRRVTFVQIVVACLASFMAMPIADEALPEFSWSLVLITGILGSATAMIQFVMNWAQKSVTPTRATLIYAGEPVWAGIFGRIAGERLPLSAIAGALLVVAGVIVSELKLKKDKS